MNNSEIIHLFDPELRELIYLAKEYDIDNIKSSKSFVIGRNYLNQPQEDTPYIRITIYIAEDYQRNIKNKTIRDYQKEDIILFNKGLYIASPNAKLYIHLTNYNGVDSIPNLGINQLKTLLKNRMMDTMDNINPDIITRIKYI